MESSKHSGASLGLVWSRLERSKGHGTVVLGWLWRAIGSENILCQIVAQE